MASRKKPMDKPEAEAEPPKVEPPKSEPPKAEPEPTTTAPPEPAPTEPAPAPAPAPMAVEPCSVDLTPAMAGLADLLERMESMRIDLQVMSDKLDDLIASGSGASIVTGSGTVEHLAADEVAEILKTETNAKFRLLEDFGHVNIRWKKGRLIEARHHKHFVAFVGAGLKVVQVAKVAKD